MHVHLAMASSAEFETNTGENQIQLVPAARWMDVEQGDELGVAVNGGVQALGPSLAGSPPAGSGAWPAIPRPTPCIIAVLQ
jgi:hypothetical protein